MSSFPTTAHGISALVDERDALVAALQKIAESGCMPNMAGDCVGAVHSRRKRYDNPERVERVGCAKHYAEKVLADLGATNSHASDGETTDMAVVLGPGGFGVSAARTVLVREPEFTEMRVVGDGQAKAFARQLIRDGKAFAMRPDQEATWIITVRETNHPSRWESV